MRKQEPDKPIEPPPFEEDLRSEFNLGSQSIPDRFLFRDRLANLTPARAISLITVLVLLILGWIFFAGPGKPVTEKLLAKLSERSPAATEHPVAVAAKETTRTKTFTPILTSTKKVLPSQTSTHVPPSKTPFFTSTETLIATDSPASSETPTPAPTITAALVPTEIPTATLPPTASISGCVPAAVVSTQDIGKTLCVTGNVLRTDSKTNSFLIILENPKDAFYFLSYDRKWEDLEVGDCVFATGKILQLGNNPVMILDYKIPLGYCP